MEGYSSTVQTGTNNVLNTTGLTNGTKKTRLQPLTTEKQKKQPIKKTDKEVQEGERKSEIIIIMPV